MTSSARQQISPTNSDLRSFGLLLSYFTRSWGVGSFRICVATQPYQYFVLFALTSSDVSLLGSNNDVSPHGSTMAATAPDIIS